MEETSARCHFYADLAYMRLNMMIGNARHLSVHGWEIGRPRGSFCPFRKGRKIEWSQPPPLSLCKSNALMCGKNDLKPPYNFDRYAKPFFPVAERLESLAVQAEDHGDTAKAAEFYLRAACVYRTARQPAPSCDTQRLAWQKQRIAFYNGAKSVHGSSHSKPRKY